MIIKLKRGSKLEYNKAILFDKFSHWMMAAALKR